MSLRSNDYYYVMTFWAFGFDAIGVILGSSSYAQTSLLSYRD